MKWYAYHCRRCGDFDLDAIAQDTVACRCGRTAKRKYQVGVIASSLKSRDRWDPVVGQYVENDGQFRSALHKSRDEQSEKTGMDVKLVEVDARDTAALAEAHNVKPVEKKITLSESDRKALAQAAGLT